MPDVKVTMETLKAGAKALGIKAGKNPTESLLKDLINKKMIALDPNFGRFACEGCGHDTSMLISTCPFCGSEYMPEVETAAQQPQDAWEDAFDERDMLDEEPTPPPAPEPPPAPVPTKEPEPAPPEPKEAPAPKSRRKARTAGKKTKPAPKHKPRQTEATKKTSKKSKTAQKLAKERKAQEREKRREQVRSGLPYSAKQLNKMKRTTVIMVAGCLGLKNPMKMGSTDTIIQAVLDKQFEKYGR